jgi:tetratricopeptide (TPR) repeat protein
MSDGMPEADPTREVPEGGRPVLGSAAAARLRDALRETGDASVVVPEAVSGALIGGRYKLLEPIGEGGMGVVWMAEQRSPIRRLVAVKLIKAGMDSAAVLARFDAERQALAMMDHPNIARIFDGGTTERHHPYFVMELVRGLPLTRYCDERRMSVRDRIDLFVLVCGAVQHAHQKGIIHRDLKPGNLLVTEHDGKPVPKVIDFGLVKALGGSSVLTDQTLHTSFGAVAGTPHYMAPEQVAINALDVDTRADIYALGVVLYELLAGTTPHVFKALNQLAWDEVRRVICDVDPPRPSLRISQSDSKALAASRHVEPARLNKLIAGELDWIVMRALEKDRHRRYGTASDLAADLQRHLTGEPVLAAPPTAIYRLRKFARRYRVALATAAAIFLVLAIGVLASTWQAVRAGRAEAVAQRESVEAQQQRSEAVRQRTEAQLQREAAQAQREAAVEASGKAQAEAATVQRQLADTYVQSGMSAWVQHDPGLAGLWFAKALTLHQGDPTRERMDRIRLGDSFRHCAWPSLATGPEDVVKEYERQFSSRMLADEKSAGHIFVSQDGAHRIHVEHGVTSVQRIAHIAIAESAQTWRFWDLNTGKPLTTATRCGDAQDFVWLSPDGKKAAVSVRTGDKTQTQLWNLSNGTQFDLGGNPDNNCDSFSDNGRWIVSTNDKVAQSWDSSTLLPVGIPYVGQTPITEALVSDETRSLLIRDNTGWLVWDTVQGVPVGPRFVLQDNTENISASQISPDGKRFILRFFDHHIVVDACIGEPICELRASIRQYITASTPDIMNKQDFSFSKDGRHIQQGTRWWDVRRPARLLSAKRQTVVQSSKGARLSADSAVIATWGPSLRFWSADSLRPLSPPIVQPVCTAAAFVPGLHEIIIGTTAGGQFHLEARQVGTGHLLRRSPAIGSTDRMNYNIGMSPNGKRLLLEEKDGDGRSFYRSGVTATLRLSDWRVRADRFEGGDFTSDDHVVFIGETARDIDSGEPVADQPKDLERLRAWQIYSQDRKSYLVTANPWYPRVVSEADGRPLTPIFPSNGGQSDFHNGVVLTTVAGGVRLWDAATAFPITSLLPCEPDVRLAKISSNSNNVLTCSDDGLFRWPIDPIKFEPADAEMLAEMLAERRIDPARDAETLEYDEQIKRFNAFLELKNKSPGLFEDDQIGADDVPEILPSYQQEVRARIVGAHTPEERQSLAREWAYAGGLEIASHCYKEAALLEESSLLLDDSNLAAADHLAQAYACLGRFADATAIYRKHAGKAYNNPAPWAEAGTVSIDFSQLRYVWPDGNDDPGYREMTDSFPAKADPDDDGTFAAKRAMSQFRLGHVQAARDLLRTALRAGANAASDSDLGKLLLSARTLIDPPSTRPTGDFNDDLYTLAWDVVKLPGQSPERHAYALEVAQRALALNADPYNLNLLGAAQYRTGKYEAALDSTARSEATDYVAQTNHCLNLSIRAMALQKLGRRDQARAELSKLIELNREPNAITEDGVPLFNEAAAMIDPASTQPTTKPATTP